MRMTATSAGFSKRTQKRRSVLPGNLCVVVAVVTKMNANPTSSRCKILAGLLGDAATPPGRVRSSTLVNGDLVADR